MEAFLQYINWDYVVVGLVLSVVLPIVAWMAWQDVKDDNSVDPHEQ
jgi:hypothetical protein